jgi:hypothetical protein
LHHLGEDASDVWMVSTIYLVTCLSLRRISASFLLSVSFWVCVIIVAVSLILNGLSADRENRGKFNE